MTDFKIGDVVRFKEDKEGDINVIVKAIDGYLLCVSTCGERWVRATSLGVELVNRHDPQADIKQAIREVLLSDEFMAAFAAAFRSEAVSQYTFSDEVRSLEHPIPGVNQPMKSSEPTQAQQLAERTIKAIWQANDEANQ